MLEEQPGGMECIQRWEWSWEEFGEPGETDGAGDAHPGEKLDQKDPRMNPGAGWDLVPGNKGQDERKQPQTVPEKV